MDFGLLYYGILTFSIYVRRKRSELCWLMFVWYPGILKFFMLLHWKFDNIGIINLKLTFRHRLGQALVFILLDKAFEFLVLSYIWFARGHSQTGPESSRETILSLKIYTIFLRFATALSHDLLLRSHISRPARPREKTVAICYCPLAHPDRPGSAKELVQILSHAQTGSDLRAVIQMIMTIIFNFLIYLSHTQTGSDLRTPYIILIKFNEDFPQF